MASLDTSATPFASRTDDLDAYDALFPGPDHFCSISTLTTLREYAKFHAGVVGQLNAGLPPPSDVSFVVYACQDNDNCGGIADRMVGLVSTFVFALRYRRVFLSAWNASYALIQSPLIDWRINSSWNNAAELLAPARNLLNCGPADAEKRCIWYRDAPEVDFPPHKPALIATNRGVFKYHSSRHRKPLRALTGTDPACVYTALFHPTRQLLNKMRPHMDVFLRYREAGVPVIGVHIRTGDNGFFAVGAAPLSEYSAPLVDAFNVALRPCLASGAAAFVASDNPSVRLRVLNMSERAFATGWQPMHTSCYDNPAVMGRGGACDADEQALAQEAPTAAFGEWWLLTLSTRLLVEPLSGYSRTALLLSPLAREPAFMSDPCEIPALSAQNFLSEPILINSGL